MPDLVTVNGLTPSILLAEILTIIISPDYSEIGCDFNIVIGIVHDPTTSLEQSSLTE